MILNERQIINRRVLTQDGYEIGSVQGVNVDVSGTWQVESLSVKLRRDILGELRMKRPMFGSQQVRITVDDIAGVSDTVVLKHALGALPFSRPTARDEGPQPQQGR